MDIKFLDFYSKNIREDLIASSPHVPSTKDILMVLHNQLDYVKIAIESIIKHTDNFHLYVWDNASDEETSVYLHQISQDLNQNQSKKMTVTRSAENIGFIVPNNEMANWGKSDYIILINSDTQVYPEWDNRLIGFLQKNPDYLQVGYQGGIVDENAMGVFSAFGEDIDYVAGWCFAIHRSTFERFGLFDPNLQFAYGEDSDFSLKLKHYGYKIYALHLALVHHFGNKTIKFVKENSTKDIYSSFNGNHEYLRQKWKNYYQSDRIALVKGMKNESEVVE